MERWKSQGSEHGGQAEGLLGHGVVVKPQDLLRPLHKVLLSRVVVEPQEHRCRHRVARRDGVVEPGLGTADELLVGLAGVEEPAVLLVPELVHHGPGEGLGPLQQLGLEGRLEQVQQAGDEEGVVVQVAQQLGLAVLVGVQQQPVVEHACEDEVHGPGAGLPDAFVAGDGVAPRPRPTASGRSRRR